MADAARRKDSVLTGTRTKIVATVGPASRAPDQLRRLAEAGASVFRLNFSHGTHDEHSATVAAIAALSRDLDRHLGVLQDLSGPKMRLGPIPGDVVHCALGETFVLVAERSSEDAHDLTCTYRNLPNDLKPGETVLFADGTVAMTVTEVARDRAALKVTLPGTLRSKQGVNLPGSALAVPSLTDQDLRDLDWTARHAASVHFVGLSFARRAADVARLRQELRSRNIPARIVVKIEKPEAVERLGEIVAEADAVMVARGDLGVEMDVHRVPAVQKRIIAACNRAHRPVITATQMLNSMEHSSRPTRAEASDVFNAVLDGSDAVMLSGESAIGEYPVEAVEMMARICAEAEAYTARRPAPPGDDAPLAGWIEPVTEAAVDAADLMTARLAAPLIVVATESGRTALALSNRRPAATILALTRDAQLAATLSICWGVTAIVRPAGAAPGDEFAAGIEWARAHGLVKRGQHAVLVRGQVAGQPGGRAVLAREV
jgi:pyruvate kinase